MDLDDADLIRDFVEEAIEHLGEVEQRLLQIEAGDTACDRELVNTVFRGIHSIKGAAGFLGFSSVERLAHRMENILNEMRNGERVPNASTIDALLRSADVLTSLINDIYNSNARDISQWLDELDRIAAAGGEPVEGDSSPTADRLSGENTCDASREGLDEMTDSAPAPVADLSNTTPDGDRTPADATTNEAETANQDAKRPHAMPDASVRVSVVVLDHLMNLAGELVLGRNQLLQRINAGEQAGLDAVGSRLDQVTSELQEAIMQTRMQPIGNVFNRFPRVVRDLCKKLNKQCELSISGEDVELDKTIIEAIADPLTHLVRNAVDHGMETPQQRTDAGKTREGTIALRACHQAGKVIIAIQDDGRGIDCEKIKQKAIARGVLTAEHAAEMSDREAVRLIFHPGFSTAEEVTDVSGRGVGMDVVKTNIEKLGGSVDVETQVGSGTVVNITMPLTLAIIPSLLVRSRNERFAIPQVNIAELVRVRPDEVRKRIGRVKRSEVLRLRGSLLPLIRLSRVLGWQEEEADDGKADKAINVIVVESGSQRYGIIVDGLHDSEEIVVKPLGRHLKNCQCLAGATVLGDGHVALILDVPGIAARMDLQVPDDRREENSASRDIVTESDAQSLLLFTNHPDEQFAVPMELISRIERVQAGQIDAMAGQELLQFRGATLPLVSLERIVNAKPRLDQTRLYVAVFTAAGREMGLIIPEIIDIRTVCAKIDPTTLHERGVMGSLVIGEQAIRLVDVVELAHVAHPDWFKAGAFEGTPDEQATILLAEDSDFFRAHVARLLAECGYNVVECTDGQAAWETLQESPEVDLIITDIEMPRLDGFQFCRRIKDHPHFSHLPVIALTSLAGDEHRHRGQNSGIDEYQVKMDRENLLSALQRWLAQKPQTSKKPQLEKAGSRA